VESFIGETAVLPMKLFTIFTSDARALDHIHGDRARIAAVIRRVANHQEWGVRVILDRARAGRAGSRGPHPSRRDMGSGAAYLSVKGKQRAAAIELAGRARETV